MNTPTVSPSHHITGTHPLRTADSDDRTEPRWLVAWQCGFEQMQIAVYGHNLTAGDAEEAAIEWMERENPSWFARDDHSADHVFKG